MHPSAMENGKLFFDTYVKTLDSDDLKVVEIGSQDVNGSLRQVCPPHCSYVGLDFTEAKGVDILLTDPYDLPLEDNSVDVVVSSSCYEHSEFFWESFMEVMRVLKDDGVFYLNVPSDGPFHRYPVDCWRFYPDSGQALANWAKRKGLNTGVLESYTTKVSDWNDCVIVFIKDEQFHAKYPQRITNTFSKFTNGKVHGNPEFINLSHSSERDKKIIAINQILTGKIQVN